MNKSTTPISLESDDHEPATVSLPTIAGNTLRTVKRVAPFVASAVLGAVTTILLRRR